MNACRGTLQLGDFLSDMNFRSKLTSFGKHRGYVHEGMLKAAMWLHGQVADELHEASILFPGWPLLITGHSYGGMWSRGLIYASTPLLL